MHEQFEETNLHGNITNLNRTHLAHIDDGNTPVCMYPRWQRAPVIIFFTSSIRSWSSMLTCIPMGRFDLQTMIKSLNL